MLPGLHKDTVCLIFCMSLLSSAFPFCIAILSLVWCYGIIFGIMSYRNVGLRHKDECSNVNFSAPLLSSGESVAECGQISGVHHPARRQAAAEGEETH